jgi:phosphoglycolate phosphatase
MFRNFIFDWSGTLVDDLGPVIEATNSVLGKYDLPPMDREGFRRRFRLPYRDFYAEVLPDVPLEELEAHFRPAFDAAVSPVTILPHAREKLEWCAALGIRTFVLTSMDTLAFERQMDDFGLRDLFEATYSGVLDKRELIHQLLANHGLDPDETAFVGDMTHDVETARHGGVSSIAVLTGYNHPEILAAVRPDITVPDLGVLRGLMDRRHSVPHPIATVGALIHDGRGRILIVRTHKWHDKWGIPGGKIKRGEPSVLALHRRPFHSSQLHRPSPDDERHPQRRSAGVPLAPPCRGSCLRSQSSHPDSVGGSDRAGTHSSRPRRQCLTPSMATASKSGGSKSQP